MVRRIDAPVLALDLRFRFAVVFLVSVPVGTVVAGGVVGVGAGVGAGAGAAGAETVLRKFVETNPVFPL